jgi:hypothetical protein
VERDRTQDSDSLTGHDANVLLQKCNINIMISCFESSNALKMEETNSSETLADFVGTTQRYNPEDLSLHRDGCQNLKYCLCSDDALK